MGPFVTAKIPGLFKRGSVYWYRKVYLPRHLAKVIGAGEYCVSLRTRDLTEAIRLAEDHRKRAADIIANAKRTAGDPEQAARVHVDRLLRDDLRDRLSRQRDDHSLDAEERGVTSRIENVTERLRRGGLSRSDYAGLREELRALQIVLDRIHGDVPAADDAKSPRLSQIVTLWAKDAKASSSVRGKRATERSAYPLRFIPENFQP